jgi:hypothetical protein
MVAVGKSIRRLRFFLLESIVLPLAILPVRAWMWTWRVHGPSPSLLAEITAQPRVIFTTWHGTLLASMVFSELWKPYGRRWVALTTPSLDGRLAAAALARLGVGSAPLVPGVRGVEAAREFLRRVDAGDIGVVIVDGPRGPRGVVKAGVPHTIAAARARVVVAGVAASRGVHLNSWDRSYLPAPFAHVWACFRLLPQTAGGELHEAVAIAAGLDAVNAEATRAVAPAPPPRPAPTNA